MHFALNIFIMSQDGKKDEIKTNLPNLANLPLKFMKQPKHKVWKVDTFNLHCTFRCKF